MPRSRIFPILCLPAFAVLMCGGCKPIENNGEGTPAGIEVNSRVEDVAWIRQMNSGDAGDWRKATSMIEAAGVDALEFLLKALRFDDGGERAPRIREYAARRMGQLKTADATVELCAALDDPDAFVRSEAAAALVGISDAMAVPLILEMLEREPRPGTDAEMGMFDVLKSMTGTFEGYEYKAGEEKRTEVIRRCRAWWAEKSRSSEK